MNNTNKNPLKGLPVRTGTKTVKLPQGSVVPLNPLRPTNAGSWSALPFPIHKLSDIKALGSRYSSKLGTTVIVDSSDRGYKVPDMLLPVIGSMEQGMQPATWPTNQ